MNGNFQNKKNDPFFCVDVFTPKVASGEKNNFGFFRIIGKVGAKYANFNTKRRKRDMIYRYA